MDSDALERARRESAAGYAEGTSIVDALVEAEWLDPDDIGGACTFLAQSDHDCIAAFHLPFPMRVPPDWLALRWPRGHPRMRFRVRGVGHNRLDGSGFRIEERNCCQETEALHDAQLRGDRSGQVLRTQVMIAFRLWGPRRARFDDYLELVSAGDLGSILVDGGRSWVPDGRALTPASYEVELADRLYRESLAALVRFMEVYPVVALDPYAYSTRHLSSFVLIMKNARLVLRGPGPSLTAQAVESFETNVLPDVTERLQAALSSDDKPTIFERYVLVALRIAEEGATALAVVQVAMVLEWMATEMIYDRAVRLLRRRLASQPRLAHFMGSQILDRRGMAEKLRVLSLIGIALPPALNQQVRALMEQRNDIVHREPRNVPIERAREAVRIGLDAVRHWLSRLEELIEGRDQSPAAQ